MTSKPLPIDEFIANMKAMSPEDKERMRREITGEADADHVERGRIYTAIRLLRTSPESLASRDYQKALSHVMQAISHIPALVSQGA